MKGFPIYKTDPLNTNDEYAKKINSRLEKVVEVLLNTIASVEQLASVQLEILTLSHAEKDTDTLKIIIEQQIKVLQKSNYVLKSILQDMNASTH